MYALLLNLVIVWLTNARLAAQHNYSNDYAKAYKLVTHHSAVFTDVANKHGQKAELLAAIVFPEMVRYNQIGNIVEAGILDLLYVEHGTQAANFSVGPCQIKPSFAEEVEMALKQNNKLSAEYEALLINRPDTILNRALRLERLSDLRWQLEYVSAFIKLTEIKLQLNILTDPTEKLAILATAYNVGLSASNDKICKAQGQKTYPNGRLGNNQYSYSEVAISSLQKIKFIFNNQ